MMKWCWCMVAGLGVLVLAGGCRPAGPVPGPANETKGAGPEAPGAAQFPVTVTDALGVALTVPGPPQRIVSMSPPTTEMLFSLGLGERVVGVTRFCDYPPEVKGKALIGGISDPSLEQILALEPDLVVATVGNPMEVVEGLRKAGVPVLSVDPKRYTDVAASLKLLGQVCGVPAETRREVGKLEEAAARVAALTRGIPEAQRPRALFVVWLEPLFVAGPGTFMDDMLTMAGAVNVAATTDKPWREYSVEMAVAADPQVLVVSTEHEPGAGDREKLVRKLQASASWKTVTAVKTGRVVVMDSDLVTRAGPRLTEGLEQLVGLVHPELKAKTAGEAR